MIDWHELRSREEDWLRVSSDAVRWRRELLRWSTNYDRQLFSQALERVRTARELLIERYVAPVFRDQLDSDSAVASTPSPERLLTLALHHEIGHKPGPHRWFDAISVFDQAFAVAQIEKRDPLERIGMAIESLIDFLSGRLFMEGFESTDFYVYYDPSQDFITSSEDVGIGRHLSHRAEGRTRRKHTLMCRRALDNGLVFLRDRIKDPFGVWLKMRRQVDEDQLENPWSVLDRCGLMFVVERREEVPALAKRITTLLEEDNAVVTSPLRANYHTESTISPINGASSSAYKVAKMRLRWKGYEFELQFITFFDYFNAKYSLTDANHAFYKGRQLRRFSFPLIWPSEIYMVEWESAYVRTHLLSWKRDQLGWPIHTRAII